jgi:carboxylesterase type B
LSNLQKTTPNHQAHQQNQKMIYSFISLSSTLMMIIFCLLFFVSYVDASLEVSIANGNVKGYYSDFPFDDVRNFLGIPFGQNPVGALRFMPPKPFVDKFNGTFDATKFGDVCIQPHGGGSATNWVKQSENCLNLNVWTPSNAEKGANLPVMVFLYGGSWKYGASSIPAYSGESLVAHSGHSVVVVSLNYRLGALGFLGSHALAARSPDRSTGNAGLQDQRLALQWVQQNIAAFGGDPNSVTLFGQSAGASSTGTQ